MRRKNNLFFSIKWKALLLFGLLLSITHAIQYGTSYKQITEQFERQHHQEQQYQLSIVKALIGQSARLIEQIAELNTTQRSNTPTQFEEQAIKAITQQWGSLQTNWGLVSISFYNQESQLKALWGSNVTAVIPNEDLTNVLRLEKPSYKLFCQIQCYQIVYIPVLADSMGEQNALFVFVRSLADIIITFKEATRTDIAILSRSSTTEDNEYGPLNIVASTNPYKLKQLLTNFYKAHPEQNLADTNGSHLDLGQQQFSLRLFNLVEPSHSNSPQLLIATDLSEDYLLIEQSKKEALYAILLALIASVVILLPILLKATHRLITVSNALPALSKGNFHQARVYLQQTRRHKYKTQDELVTLEQSATMVIDQLEKGSQLIREKEQNLVWLADHDSLTKLFNRRRFQLEFEQQLKISQRYRSNGAILYLDLDQFKYINDTSGHGAGDLLLKQVAETIQQTIRSSDILARLGGDEFALLLPNIDAHGATQFAQKIIEKLRLMRFEYNGTQHNISASIGIAMFPEYGLTVQNFMSNADIAMYQAKESGRSKSHLYSQKEQTKELLKTRILWKEKIEAALADKRLCLHFQPILDIKTNQISHAEALVRMIDLDGEIIMPNSFIPIAEQSGLINQIDLAVLQLAFETLRFLQTQNNPLKLSINLSGKAFNNTLLISTLKEGLKQQDIDAKKLIIEVTETTAVANINTAVNLMNDIKETGAKFALDDFGVGYASFFYLRQLPVDYIKIDGSFIQTLEKHKEDQVFVKAVSEISQLSGLKTIAEFVENQTILDLLASYNIDYAQGYHIAKPSATLPNNKLILSH
ncbi:MAG: EAL domain-containing protein [Cycloclasticus pugetii]|uniref:bifunctional diguanylate cyclase/phosphodiesterase n=1 Tax=Cycloclasticus pugetii TaxID=34068 RepID=UPI003A90BBF7